MPTLNDYTTLDAVCDMRQHSLDPTEVAPATNKEILELCEPKLEDHPQTPTTQSIYQKVQTGITIATSILEYLKDKSILKYTALLVLLVLANYVGEVVHNSIPILSGIPTIVGTIYLSSLIKAENRKKVLQTLNQYIGTL